MKNADYWRGRALILEGAAHKQGVDYAADLDREFKAASKRIQTEIEAWYARFAANNEITLAEAKRWLTGRDLEEFRWTVQEYIKAGESLNPAFLKQLENASARVHISRLEALELQLQQQVEVLYGNHVDGLDKTLQGLYREGYYHTAFEIQRGFNLGWDLQGLNEKQIAAVLNRPWSTDGQTFRDRCWKNKAELVNAVQTGLIQGFIRGDGPDKATKLIVERFRVSSNKAARLVMTESAYFAAQSQHDCYKDLDVGEFEVVETLDGHTCDICQGLDGAVFPMSDYEPGVTVPPFHPWCRGCTAPHFPDNYGERIARGADGKTYFVPADMKYQDWYDAFVEGGSKADLTPLMDISDGGKFKVLSFDNQSDYHHYIGPEYNAQRMTHRDNEILWDESCGYIQNAEGYRAINEYERGTALVIDEKYEKTIEVLDRRTSAVGLKQDYVGFRKVDISYLESVLGIDTTGLVEKSYQTTNLGKKVKLLVPKNQQSAQVLADAINALVGTDKATVLDRGFTSISLCEKVNYFTHYPVQFEIQMPTGTKGLITNNWAESEFITKRGTAIEILGAEVYNDGTKDCVRVFGRLIQD